MPRREPGSPSPAERVTDPARRTPDLEEPSLVSKDSSQSAGDTGPLPFGSIADREASPKRRARRASAKRKSQGPEDSEDKPKPKRKAKARSRSKSESDGSEGKPRRSRSQDAGEDGSKPRKVRRHSSRKEGGSGESSESSPRKKRSRRRAPAPEQVADPELPPDPVDERSDADEESGEGRRSRSRKRSKEDGRGPRSRPKGGSSKDKPERIPKEGEGMFVLDKGNVGILRQADNQYLSCKRDIFVPKHLIQRWKLRDGMMIKGRISRGQKHKFQLVDIAEIDGKEPKAWLRTTPFKNLTSVDPDFHYAVGDITGDVSMRIMDILAPVGRGQRGLLVAPPKSGKTTILRSFAKGIEVGYPDVHLMVLLVNERPEEATEWQRSLTRGTCFVSTADETDKHHIQVAEVAWRRAMRLVEMGEDVVLLLDSITRLARAYNNYASSGRTMSGGLDSKAMERPRKLFGSARNTVEAGSLTILGTTLVQTGSRMDQLVFEEFKGTGNMELVLSRRLADRRIFPAIDIELSGTRKEEKLVGMRRLRLIHTLRRVLSRLHWAEAMDTLITRLSDVEKTDDFLTRFEVDPEA